MEHNDCDLQYNLLSRTCSLVKNHTRNFNNNFVMIVEVILLQQGDKHANKD